MPESAHKIITNLEESGELKILIRAGYCSPCILRNLELFRFVDSRVKTGSKITQAVLDAEVEFKLCQKTVFNILKSFK